KEAWLGFNPRFRGFGGEEFYIHEKFRQAGRQCWCLPWLRWLHRFGRPGGVPYPNTLEDRLWDYLVGWDELGLPLAGIYEHFLESMTGGAVARVATEALGRPVRVTVEEVKDLASPLKMRQAAVSQEIETGGSGGRDVSDVRSEAA